MVSENGLSIGQRIRQQRERLNWSQERLAESVGATKMSVRRWEHDIVLPQPYYREQLCRVFNVTSEMLFGAQEAERDVSTPASGGVGTTQMVLSPCLAELYREQGKYTEAEDLLHRAIILCEKRLDWQEIDMVETLHILALLHQSQNHIAEAEQFYQRILTLLEEAPDLQNSDIRAILNDYVAFLYETDRLEEAKALEQRLEASKETVKG